MENVVCLCTAPPDAALEIADAVVGDGLVACVNILPLVQSVYRWQGQMERTGESLLVIKTTRGAVAPLTVAIGKLHPYETFELVALDIVDGAPAYLDWIAASVTQAGL